MKDIRCLKLGKGDITLLIQLLKVYENAFDKTNYQLPHKEYLKHLLQHPTLLFYVATLNKQVLGGLTAHLLPTTNFTGNELYIYDLAVSPSWQRKGIGRELMSSLQLYCRKLTVKTLFVQADIGDQHAVDFYKATGGDAVKVVHFNYTITPAAPAGLSNENFPGPI